MSSDQYEPFDRLYGDVNFLHNNVTYFDSFAVELILKYL